MKFALLTDIHLGPEFYFKGILRKVNKDVKIYLEEFIEEMNGNVKPEFVAVLGDLVEDDNKENDENNIVYIVELLKKLEYPVYYVAGNHDLRNIPEGKLAELFNQNSLYYSFDSTDFHFIVLFSKSIEEESVLIAEEQILWLKDDLSKTDKKCIVFVHHGLADQDLKGNPWFEGKPGLCLVANRKEIRSIFE
jgi:3',5'-cyclic AMP phosphodiesterase CpdA